MRIQQTDEHCSCVCRAQLQKSETLLDKSRFVEEFEGAQNTDKVILLDVRVIAELPCIPLLLWSDTEPVRCSDTHARAIHTIIIV